jgi:hypothetical protein
MSRSSAVSCAANFIRECSRSLEHRLLPGGSLNCKTELELSNRRLQFRNIKEYVKRLWF